MSERWNDQGCLTKDENLMQRYKFRQKEMTDLHWKGIHHGQSKHSSNREFVKIIMMAIPDIISDTYWTHNICQVVCHLAVEKTDEVGSIKFGKLWDS